MRPENAKIGNIVQVDNLGSTTRMMVDQSYLDNRRLDARGPIVGVTYEHPEWIIWVKHGVTAPYRNYELTLVGELTCST